MSSSASLISRRSFLIAATAASAVPGNALAKRAAVTDVIVIGAGIGGLNTALELSRQGLNVRVLEASDRIGGRIRTLDDVEYRPEGGATEVGAQVKRLRGMIARAGLTLRDRVGKPNEYGFYLGDDYIAPADWATSPHNRLPAPLRAIAPNRIESYFMAKPNPLGLNPRHWLDPAFRHLDVPFSDYLRTLGADDVALDFLLRGEVVESLDKLSALWALHRDSATDLSRSLPDNRDLQFVVEGMSRVPEAMARMLPNGVELNRPVAGVRVLRDGVEVVTADGRRHRAKHVVVAVPPQPLRGIRFDPVLPARHADAVATMPMGQGTSLMIPVHQPYWEVDGRPGGMWTDNDRLGRIMQLATPTGNYIWVYISGRANRAYRTMADADIMASVLAELKRIRPSTEGRLGRGRVVNWSGNRFIGGTFARLEPGQPTRFGDVLATPAHRRVHFAGEHTALDNGGMEGALESGERAARAIVEAN